MRIIFILLFMVAGSVSLASYIYDSPSWLSDTGSAISNGMGEVGAVADIWHDHPKMAISNPAQTALFDGTRVSMMQFHYKPLQGDTFDYKGSANVLAISRHGWGLMLPLPNQVYGWGDTYTASTSYYKYARSNSDDNRWNRAIFALSVDPIRVLSLHKNKVFSNMDLSMGLTETNLNVNEQLYIEQQDRNRYTAKYGFTNFGLLAVYSVPVVFNSGSLDIRASFGYQHRNLEHRTLTYPYEYQKVTISQAEDKGCGLSISLPQKPQHEIHSDFINQSAPFLALRGLYGYRNSEVDYWRESYGGEVSMLDMIFIRMGQVRDESRTDDPAASIGWGLKLHYKNHYHLEYNQASYRDPVFNSDYSIWDMAVSYTF